MIIRITITMTITIIIIIVPQHGPTFQAMASSFGPGALPSASSESSLDGTVSLKALHPHKILLMDEILHQPGALNYCKS